MRVPRDAILAFRIAAQGLAERAGGPAEAAASWAIQDSPPGSAALALHARAASAGPEVLQHALAEERSLLRLYNPRSAISVIPSAETELFTAALRPTDAAALRHLVAQAVPDRALPDERAVELAVEAVADALDGRVLSRDELHEELRARLPAELLPWCPGCGSHHAKRGLLNAATLHGVLCHAGARHRQAAFARTDQWLGRELRPVDPEEAQAELVRRYLRGYGPSTPAHLAQWAGIARSHASTLWKRVEPELAEVEPEGGRRAWVLAEDADRLADPPAPRGVRLLPAGDPLLQARDREVLVPDTERHAQIWRAIGNAGLVLADGRAVGTWRPRKQGRRLLVAVEPFEPLTPALVDALEAEAGAIAPHRGAETASLDLAA